MPSKDRNALLSALQQRFEAHAHRHAGIAWSEVRSRLNADPAALDSLAAMERTGGEPDVIGRGPAGDTLVFCDCSAESPSGRRSLCFDGAALAARKANKPAGSAMELAAEMGVAILTEAEYRALQQLGEFDRKTSSWIATPAAIRANGGALFCDRRYDHVFVYHNGAESYYGVRGFRGRLIV
jgi:hypothetical protein